MKRKKKLHGKRNKRFLIPMAQEDANFIEKKNSIFFMFLSFSLHNIDQTYSVPSKKGMKKKRDGSKNINQLLISFQNFQSAGFVQRMNFCTLAVCL